MLSKYIQQIRESLGNIDNILVVMILKAKAKEMLYCIEDEVKAIAHQLDIIESIISEIISKYQDAPSILAS